MEEGFARLCSAVYRHCIVRDTFGQGAGHHVEHKNGCRIQCKLSDLLWKWIRKALVPASAFECGGISVPAGFVP
jgi:hypothetical protein